MINNLRGQSRYKILFVLILLLVIIIVTELTVRVFLSCLYRDICFINFPFNVRVDTAFQVLLKPIDKNEDCYIDRNIFFPVRLVKYTIGKKTNLRSCINYRNTNAIKVVILGGSSTFGHALSDFETFPFFMQRLLEEENVVVINAGFLALSLENIMLSQIKTILSLKPDVVVIYAGYNGVPCSLNHGAFLYQLKIMKSPFFLPARLFFIYKIPYLKFKYRQLLEKTRNYHQGPFFGQEAKSDKEIIDFFEYWPKRYLHTTRELIKILIKQNIKVVIVDQLIWLEDFDFPRDEEEVRSIKNKLLAAPSTVTRAEGFFCCMQCL